MGLKTVLKLLLSKFGILSIEMQRAISFDQAVVRGEVNNVSDIDLLEPEYIDNEPAVIEATQEDVDPAKDLFGEKENGNKKENK